MSAETTTQARLEATLEDEQANLRHHEEQLSRARNARDAAILDARNEGISMYRIAQVIGISQQAVAQIVRANR